MWQNSVSFFSISMFLENLPNQKASHTAHIQDTTSRLSYHKAVYGEPQGLDTVNIKQNTLKLSAKIYHTIMQIKYTSSLERFFIKFVPLIFLVRMQETKFAEVELVLEGIKIWVGHDFPASENSVFL